MTTIEYWNQVGVMHVLHYIYLPPQDRSTSQLCIAPLESGAHCTSPKHFHTYVAQTCHHFHHLPPFFISIITDSHGGANLALLLKDFGLVWWLPAAALANAPSGSPRNSEELLLNRCPLTQTSPPLLLSFSK